MVNNINPYLKILTGLPLPPDNNATDKKDRFIGRSRLWDLSEVVDIVLLHEEAKPTVRMVTDDSISNHRELLENGFDLKEAALSLKTNGRFKNACWCKTSPSRDAEGRPRGRGFWIPCDAYTLSLEFVHPKTGYSGVCEYYFKMCKGLDGTTVLFVSLHV